MLVRFVLSFLFAASFVQFNAKAEVVPAKDGVPINYSVQGKGDPALVFIHCWSCDRHLWDNQVSVFAKEHRIVTIDLPGHGQSGQGRKSWSIENYADDVNVVITKLKLTRAILIGSSMGGPIALEATRRMPGKLRHCCSPGDGRQIGRYHRNTAVPQARPAPKPESRMWSPRRRRPAARASLRASGMLPAEVLP